MASLGYRFYSFPQLETARSHKYYLSDTIQQSYTQDDKNICMLRESNAGRLHRKQAPYPPFKISHGPQLAVLILRNSNIFYPNLLIGALKGNLQIRSTIKSVFLQHNLAVIKIDWSV